MSMLRPALTLAALFLWAGTLVAAEWEGLRVVRDFGPIPMGFTIHARRGEMQEF